MEGLVGNSVCILRRSQWRVVPNRWNAFTNYYMLSHWRMSSGHMFSHWRISSHHLFSHWRMSSSRRKSWHISMGIGCHHLVLRDHEILLFHTIKSFHTHSFFKRSLLHSLCNMLFNKHLLLILFHLFLHSCVSFHLFVSLHLCLHHHLMVPSILLKNLILSHLCISQRNLQLLICPHFDCFYLILLVQIVLNFHVRCYETFELDREFSISLYKNLLVPLHGFHFNL